MTAGKVSEVMPKSLVIHMLSAMLRDNPFAKPDGLKAECSSLARVARFVKRDV